MSDPKCISPLLDGFQLGAPISEHNGTVCCPAIKENTNKKYIVKIITVPASQSQLDALLLAGAYKDPADAMEYFRRQGEQILAEAQQLKLLSKMEGFLPYDGWQMEPITRRRLGYEIYLLGSYKRSLEKYMSRNPFTHLEAINLSLDLCSALSVCRQSGYLYADLKPSNIYVSENRQYRIGDLGFLSLDSLRYASLPERYYSPYTPPELLDPMTPMNLSVDTYPVGMILYQLYNDGHLPFTGMSPQQTLPPPIHADYELAEIIMRAIDPDPEKRWTDPKDLGKAIAAYMQRNRVNDIPITPFIPLDVIPEAIGESEKPQKRVRRKKKAADPEVKAEDIPEPAPTEQLPDQTGAVPEEIPAEDAATLPEGLQPEETSEDPEPTIEGTPEVPADERAVSSTEEARSEEMPDASVVPEESADAPVSADEPEEKSPALSEEAASIIAKADDLITHEIPEAAIFTPDTREDPFAFLFEDSDGEERITDEAFFAGEDSDETPEPRTGKKHYADQSRRKKITRFFFRLLSLMLLCAAVAGGFWFYQNMYLQSIDGLSVIPAQDQLTVLIDTAVDEAKLTAVCTDNKGKQRTEAVTGGKAVFDGLEPGTAYTVDIRISGFHKLTGKASDVFTTEASTQVLSFDAIAGSEDGSVLLEFTVDGEEPNFWNILYSAEGEEEKRETITNHSTMITGLSVGKVYTFRLDGGKNFLLGGKTSLQYLASKLILADNLTAVSDSGNDVTIQWDTPGDVIIDSWKVRCHDGYGFEEEVTVTDTQALFTGLDPATAYTVEVTAAGMTQPRKIRISADPIIVSGFRVDESSGTALDITWEYTGNAPEGGWNLLYSVDGSESQSLSCKDASASLAPLLPGADYRFWLEAADGRTVFNNIREHSTAEAEVYADNGIVPENLSVDLLQTPETQQWRYETLENPSFTDTFQAGSRASIVLRSTSTFYLPGYQTSVLYVFRNAYGNVLTELVAEETPYWKDIWNSGDPKIGELNIPALPSAPGAYILELYFNGKSVARMDITITE